MRRVSIEYYNQPVDIPEKKILLEFGSLHVESCVSFVNANLGRVEEVLVLESDHHVPCSGELKTRRNS